MDWRDVSGRPACSSVSMSISKANRNAFDQGATAAIAPMVAIGLNR